LAISEFVEFDYAYLIASAGTILLIGMYAKSHFNSWRSSGIFSGVLTLLYGFIFILIRLEDAALLVGSIGLFIILALTMYGSKKVNWYGQAEVSVLQ
jgi:inner membrane protein